MRKPDARPQQLLVLKGWPSVRDFVRLVKRYAVNGDGLQYGELTEEWRRSSAVVETFERTPQSARLMTALPESISQTADALLRDPRTAHCFELFRPQWAMVELEQLIPWQKYLNLSYTDELRRPEFAEPTPDDLLRFVAGETAQAPEVSLTATRGGSGFVFSSGSSDMRLLDIGAIDPILLQGRQYFGRVAAVLAVVVGYSMNIVSAVRMGERIVLLNGTHRVYALLAQGIKRAPCLVSHARSASDLELLAPLANGNQPLEWHFSYPRPPQLRDFFDDRITKLISTVPATTVLALELTFSQANVPV